MSGFPPVISHVGSFFEGRLFVGQTVEALSVPGKPVMNLNSGGFTGANVTKELERTAHIEGRQLTVKDGHKVSQEVGSDAAFDDCVIL